MTAIPVTLAMLLLFSWLKIVRLKRGHSDYNTLSKFMLPYYV